MQNLQNTLTHIALCSKSSPSCIKINKISYYIDAHNLEIAENLTNVNLIVDDFGSVIALMHNKNHEFTKIYFEHVHDIDITLTTPYIEERFICDDNNYNYNVKYFSRDEGCDNLAKKLKEYY